MKSTQTKWLLLGAGVLFAYIALVERRHSGSSTAPKLPELLLPGLQSARVTGLEFTRSNQVLRAERTGGLWRLTQPITYPARSGALERLLEICAQLRPQAVVHEREVRSQADFGLQPPQSVLVFHQGTERLELRIGARTPVSNQLYVQLAGTDHLSVTDAALLDLLPAAVSDWRDHALVSLEGIKFDRFRFRTGPRDLLIQREATHAQWRIAQPPPLKRADNGRIEHLLRELQRWPVQQFVTDDPAADPDAFGFRAPEAELAFSQGTNETLVVQFGRSPTNNPALVYARSLRFTNVVLVAREWLDHLRVPYWDFCDHRLLDVLSPGSVDTISVEGPEVFTLRQQTNLTWLVDGPTATAVDPPLFLHFLENLATLEAVELAKEVVTDFASYGLDPPQRRISLLKTITNATGGLTNRLVAQLDFGTNQIDRTFARRHDENSVYVVPRGSVELLPSRFYQIQDRQLWNFGSNQVLGVTVRHEGSTRELKRAGGKWTEAGQQRTEVQNAALEEAMFRLGKLRAEAWTHLGNDRLANYGVAGTNHTLTIVLHPPTTASLTLSFGYLPARRNPYAMVMDPRTGKPLVFEFPRALYLDYVLPYLGEPAP